MRGQHRTAGTALCGPSISGETDLMDTRWLSAWVCGVLPVLFLFVGLSGGPADRGTPVTTNPASVGPGATWVEVAGEVYGARPDERGPIGGGAGYAASVTEGHHTARTLDQLLAALAKVRKGEVVFIPGTAEIDCTERVHIERLVLEVPAGVTLASDRGRGGSPGAIVLSDTFATRPLIRALGPGVRVTGLRVRGPDPKRRMEHHRRSFADGRGREYYYKFPVSDGIETEHDGLEVDNCEISAFSHAGVYLRKGKDHHIHHNFIHHCQYNGLGYGVCHDTAFSLIELNLFDWNRHSIAGTGRPGSGYEARNNVELGTSLSHCFDMHGGRDRGDGTNIAGTWLKVHHNTFRAPQTPLVIRGLPSEGADVHHNWFTRHTTRSAVNSPGNTRVHDNAYGSERPAIQ